jgi:carbamoyl-phosphate synthase large subunit
MDALQSFVVLVSSLSKKIPLVKAIRNSFKSINVEGKIIGADSDKNAIGNFFVDKFWNMPPLKNLSSEEFIHYCNTQKIQAVIPTRDGELPFFAANKEIFKEKGIHCMVSNPKAINLCNDKLFFYRFCKDGGYPVILTSESLNFDAPSYVVKQRFGAASVLLGLKLTKKSAIAHANILTIPLFQPYIDGIEYSVDVFVDSNSKVKGCISRKRELVIHGESQITTSVNYPELVTLCSELAVKLGIYGHAVFQVIKETGTGDLLIVECNPRFGGASTLSIAMGLITFEWFFSEVMGKNLANLPFVRSKVEKKQVRYPEDLIIS